MATSGKTSNRSLNYKIALTGILGALSVVLSVTPIGYIQIGMLAITIMHIPAILAAVMAGLVPGIGVGLIFGITSLVRASITGSSPFFVNPLVSVLPRMLFPVFVYFIDLALRKIRLPKVISGGISAALGTFIHTVLVMGMIFLIYIDSYLPLVAEKLVSMGFNLESISGFGLFAAIIGLVELTNGLWEILGAAVITVAVLASSCLVKNRKSKLSKIEEPAE